MKMPLIFDLGLLPASTTMCLLAIIPCRHTSSCLKKVKVARMNSKDKNRYPKHPIPNLYTNTFLIESLNLKMSYTDS